MRTAKITRTYLKINESANNRHPREGGGPRISLKCMDSRLRGNDALKLSVDEH